MRKKKAIIHLSINLRDELKNQIRGQIKIGLRTQLRAVFGDQTLNQTLDETKISRLGQAKYCFGDTLRDQLEKQAFKGTKRV